MVRNVLVLGANGQIGDAVIQALRGNKYNAYGVTSRTVDYRSSSAIYDLIQQHSIEHVVNCVAYTDVEKAEDVDEASTVNFLNMELPTTLARITKKVRISLTHFSTDYVFDGNSTTPYKEDTITSPLNYYGHTKLIADKILGCFGGVRIFRVSMVYGRHGKNFVRTMQKLATEQYSIKVVADQYTVPTQADWIASHTVNAIKTPFYGLYNLVPDGHCTPAELARFVVDGECQIEDIKLADYPTKAKRPKYSVLNNSLYKKTFGLSDMGDWRSVYQEYQI